MNNYREKDGMLMIFRAVIITAILTILVGVYMLYEGDSKPVQQLKTVYMDSEGVFYDVSVLEQKAFVRLMLIKKKKIKPSKDNDKPSTERKRI